MESGVRCLKILADERASRDSRRARPNPSNQIGNRIIVIQKPLRFILRWVDDLLLRLVWVAARIPWELTARLHAHRPHHVLIHLVHVVERRHGVGHVCFVGHILHVHHHLLILHLHELVLLQGLGVQHHHLLGSHLRRELHLVQSLEALVEVALGGRVSLARRVAHGHLGHLVIGNRGLDLLLLCDGLANLVASRLQVLLIDIHDINVLLGAGLRLLLGDIRLRLD